MYVDLLATFVSELLRKYVFELCIRVKEIHG